MEPEAASYLFALGTISTTFVGFSALIMMFRQTAGSGLSPLDSWITMVFIQLGFIVTAGSLLAPLLALCGVPASLVWRICSGIVGVTVGVFAASYPARRHAVAGVAAPWYVWGNLTLLALCTIALIANTVGSPLAPNSGTFSFCLTVVLFVGGIGYLNALGSMHRETTRTKPPSPPSP
jgi:hypothetical protein